MTDREIVLANFARGFVSQRSSQGGWEWLESAVRRVSTPVAKARILQFSDDPKAAWDCARELGPEVEEAYWAEFLSYGHGVEFKLAGEAATQLLDHGRPAAALDLLSLYHASEQSNISSDLIMRVLEAFSATEDMAASDRAVSVHEIESLLDFLRSRSDVDEERLALLEWRFLPALAYQPSIPILERKLARDPNFFIQILSLCYKRADGEIEHDVADGVAMNAYRLLREWKIVPGSTKHQGEVDANQLSSWMQEARRLARRVDRADIADICIGEVMAHARGDDDGTWPTLPVRDSIERVASTHLERGFHTGIYNKRGVTSRGLTDGGRQEYDLAQRFGNWAQMIADMWPRTAAVLRGLAEGYRVEGKRHDEEADRIRRGL